jgi:putative ABC transport system permease protein
MRWLIANHIQNAKQSLQSNRVRSILTMLGVTIGVASVTAILALGGGASKIVDNQISKLGGNIIVVRPGKTESNLGNITQPQTSQGYATSTLTESDVSKLRKLNHIDAVAPLMILGGTMRSEDQTASSSSKILATTPDFDNITNLAIREGQFLDAEIADNAAVVGQQLSVNLFGTESSIGRTMTIRGKRFVVVGTLKMTNNPINYNSVDLDNAAIINFDTGKDLNDGVSQIQQINIKADSVNNLDGAVKEANSALTKNHNGENDFSVLARQEISQPTSQLFYSIAGVTAAIAAISLFVGGIGIMNIMLVTVAERTHEIGIRKSLGASNNDILYQFLIESLAISIGGGIIGYIFGYAVAFTASEFLDFTPAINWQIAMSAMLISIFMGTLFGLYPAIRAARKDPIDSLNRHD